MKNNSFTETNTNKNSKVSMKNNSFTETNTNKNSKVSVIESNFYQFIRDNDQSTVLFNSKGSVNEQITKTETVFKIMDSVQETVTETN
jgi:hypothetical protein